MNIVKSITLLLVFLQMSLFVTAQSFHDGTRKQLKKYESAYKTLSEKVDGERIKKGVYHLAGDLPRRVLNWTVPGHSVSSLEEADLWLIQKMSEFGYKPQQDETRVRAFGRDFTKPAAHQYATPAPDAPWYIAHNIISEIKGKTHPDDLIIVIAHKDSQSWIDSPGANDNAVGTIGALELALVLSKYKPNHTIRFLFSNEEHTPWTSITAAENIKKEGTNLLALINLDAIGSKGPELAGRMTNVTRYTSPQGEKIADLFIKLNTYHNVGLEQSKFGSKNPGDDDGIFIKAGFPWSVMNIGSIPYNDPNYHLESDTPDKVDYKNAELTVKLTLAAILYLDTFGQPR